MDATYPLYAGSDPVFYDKPRLKAETAVELFAPADALKRDMWEQADDEVWSYWTPPGVTLPEQGWKIHVSATAATAETVLARVSEHCHRNALPFKFVRTRPMLALTLAKDGDRCVSGKFIAIYPTSLAELESHLTELDAALSGSPGPYVLTDLRWKQGPVFVRYGAFLRQTVNDNGADVPAIRDLDTGILVPDVRTTAFHVPPWAEIPDFLQVELDQLGMTPPDGFPQVRGALHFSNAGGVYEAMLDGRPVILKEARPHVGWTPDGRDAVRRLRDEAGMLESLHRDVPVPAAIDTFDHHGHSYLAMERIDAVSLSAAVTARNPLVTSNPSAGERRAYRDWAAGVADSLRGAVASLHARGRVHGDLHPGNVLVREDRTVVLIDLEMSRPIEDARPALIGAPGFIATDDRGGLDQDLYALACTELFMFVPLIPLLTLDEAKAGVLVREAARQFELSQTWVDRQLATLARRTTTAPDTSHRPALTDSVDTIAKSLLADASPERHDRLWPGDPAQFNQPPASLAHGALGVLVVLHRAGVAPPPELLAWVERTETGSGRGAPQRLGLLDGLAGTVWAYRQLGEHELADRRLSQLTSSGIDRLGADLYGGLPGIGLTLLEEQHAPSGSVAAIATQLREWWRHTEPPSRVATGAGGLMNGATGTALFALRLFEATGDQEHLRIATEAMDFDLHSLRPARDGSLQVDEGWRLLPYLGNGSAGIGVVLAQLLAHLPGHSRYLEILDGITRAATAPLTAQCGLLEGRAGLIHFLHTLGRANLATKDVSTALHRHVAALELHTIRHDERTRFAGNGMMRASCDLATGAAGVLATLIDYNDAATGQLPESTVLPFLIRTARSNSAPLAAADPSEEVR